MQSGALATALTKELSHIMTEPDFQVNNPHQLSLVDEEVYEIVLRVGVIRGSDHAQFQLDVTEAHTGELISCSSRLHVSLDQVAEELTQWQRRLKSAIWEHTGPF